MSDKQWPLAQVKIFCEANYIKKHVNRTTKKVYIHKIDQLSILHE